jgi:hypothetical protein
LAAGSLLLAALPLLTCGVIEITYYFLAAGAELFDMPTVDYIFPDFMAGSTAFICITGACLGF